MARRTQFQLENNRPTNHANNNPESCSQWTSPVADSGSSISEDGSGVWKMVVTGGGNMTIAGTLNQLSDVAAEEGLEARDSTDVLAKVGAPSAAGGA